MAADDVGMGECGGLSAQAGAVEFGFLAVAFSFLLFEGGEEGGVAWVCGGSHGGKLATRRGGARGKARMSRSLRTGLVTAVDMLGMERENPGKEGPGLWWEVVTVVGRAKTPTSPRTLGINPERWVGEVGGTLAVLRWISGGGK